MLAREQKLNEAGCEAAHEAGRHDSEYRLDVLYSISKALGARSTCKEMLTTVLAVLKEKLGMENGTIMLVTPDGRELAVEATLEPISTCSSLATYQRGEGIVGQVMQTGKGVLVPRVGDEPRLQHRLYPQNTDALLEMSFICVPITDHEEVLGTLSANLRSDRREELVNNKRLLSIVSCMIATNVRARRIAKADRQILEVENRRLREALGENYRPENMIGSTRAMQGVFQRIHQVAQSNTTVLIRGESGTGKELVAAAIHFCSSRRDGPFIKVNCAQLNDNLLESELFGHEKGSFTGASRTRIGRFEEARGGTLFLDELGDFSTTIQVKLLRVLQERVIQRVGSNEDIEVDVRIVAATNRGLESMVDGGTFRQDLYYRVNVFAIQLPPLRERKADIPALADHFVQRFAAQMNKEVKRISTTAINMMLAYHWPGNVRELENCIEHAVLLSSDGVVHGRNLPPTLQMPLPGHQTAPVGTLKWHTRLLEKDMITDALKRNRDNVRAVAKELGLSPRMVRYKIRDLAIARVKSNGS